MDSTYVRQRANFLSSARGRPDLNHPPTAVGGIHAVVLTINL
ncbi:MAG TPA: hypothetical protein VL866_06415 [Pyrinomonadaceae bacterium]|nr:hypothetical protein [Pyrinomonadaceae bacterium]